MSPFIDRRFVSASPAEIAPPPLSSLAGVDRTGARFDNFGGQVRCGADDTCDGEQLDAEDPGVSDAPGCSSRWDHVGILGDPLPAPPSHNLASLHGIEQLRYRESAVASIQATGLRHPRPPTIPITSRTESVGSGAVKSEGVSAQGMGLGKSGVSGKIIPFETV